MALIESTGRMTYVTIYRGQLEVRVDPNTPDAQVRTTESGKQIHCKYYRAIEGRITDIKKNISEWNGKKLVSLDIHLDDVGEKYILQLSYRSQPATCFFNFMENIDLTAPISFSVGTSTTKSGKESTSLFARQNDRPLKWRYTRENPGNKPQWKKMVVNGDETWDRTDELRYFENIIKTQIKPKLQELAGKNHVETQMDDFQPPEAPAKTAPQTNGNNPPRDDSYFPTTEPAGMTQGDTSSDLPF